MCFLKLYSNLSCCQADLFFYREPEEAKENQEEEVPALPEYPEYGATLAGDWSSSQIPEAQWSTDVAPPAPAAAGEWSADAG